MQIVRELRPADILLFQEVVRSADSHPSVAEVIAQKTRHERSIRLAGSRSHRVRNRGSKPFSTDSGGNLPSQTNQPDIPVAQASTSWSHRADSVGPIRIVCAHLDTRINPADRLRELEPAIEDAKQFGGPVLIAGDLNTNDMQWVSHVVPVPWPGWQASRVRDLMAQNGFHTPFVNRRATFDHLGMQLDWIFLRNLGGRATDIVPMEFSDHHALVAVIGPAGK